MSSKKIITVFGATGNQGGSVISIWLNDKDLQSRYAIRAVTRDPSKQSAKDLEAKGVQTVAGNLDDVEAIKKAVEGSYGVFGVTNYWEFMDKAKELAQGKALADAVFASGVKHIVFSTLPHTTKLTNGKLPHIDHFVAKAEVGEYIEANKSKTGTLATYYEPAFFMSNFKGFIKPGQDGKPTFAVPYGPDSLNPLIDINADTGKYVWGALEAGKAADGKKLQAVGDWVTTQQLVDTFTQYGQTGGEVVTAQVPGDVFEGFLKPVFGDLGALEMRENMELIGEYSYYGKGTEKNQAASDEFLYKGAGPKVSFKEYVKKTAPYNFA